MAQLNSRQLRYFLTVAQEGQITRAAQKLHIAQPPLSQQIKQLEQEFGVQLLERAGRGVRLTRAGEILAHRGQDVLSMFEDVERELDDYQKGPHGTLQIGTVASSGATILPQLLCLYHQSYPDVDFQVREGNTFRVIELLQSETIEIGIIRTPFDEKLFEVRRSASAEEPMVAAGSGTFAFCKNTPMPITGLCGKPIIMHRRYESIFLRACKGFVPEILCHGDDVRSLLTWADSGLGIAVVPQSVMHLVKGASLTFRELDEPSLFTSVVVIWLKGRYLSVTARQFIEFFTRMDVSRGFIKNKSKKQDC